MFCFFLVKKKSLKGGHLLVQKVQNQIYQLKIHLLKCFAFVWIQIFKKKTLVFKHKNIYSNLF